MTYLDVNTIGLCLDIIGVLFIFRFALPPQIGGSFLMLESGVDVKAKKTRYGALSLVGLALLVAGFGLQIVSNIMQGLGV